ncbi:MAG: hypothetical protein KDG89_00975 [Geminicoccaceae bacterium]|nr:hypothetical protein [Geminicoccaceae bacterium]
MGGTAAPQDVPPFEHRWSQRLTEDERAGLTSVLGLPPDGKVLILLSVVDELGRDYWRRKKDPQHGSSNAAESLSKYKRRMRNLANAVRDGRDKPEKVSKALEALVHDGVYSAEAVAAFSRQEQVKHLRALADMAYIDPYRRLDCDLNKLVERLAMV